MPAFQVTVRAVPDDPTHPDHTPYLLECTICGILGVWPPSEVDPIALGHLHEHGADAVQRQEKP